MVRAHQRGERFVRLPADEVDAVNAELRREFVDARCGVPAANHGERDFFAAFLEQVRRAYDVLESVQRDEARIDEDSKPRAVGPSTRAHHVVVGPDPDAPELSEWYAETLGEVPGVGIGVEHDASRER